MKKQWISVKCGLSRDPKHRQAMGESIWLFLHMLDTASWDDGIVHDWKDEDAAEEMGMPIRTLREHRRKLAELDYITCNQKQYTQDIVIHNWTNPREYNGQIYNQKQGDAEKEPLESQGDTQGYIQGNRKDVTPTSNSNNQLSKPLSIENAIFLDKPVTEEMAKFENLRATAPHMFEVALGFSKSLPWWDGDKDWKELGEWVCVEYEKDKASFGRYNVWRNTKYTKGGIANTRLRGFPKEFYDSWDMFKQSDGEQPHKTDETKPNYDALEAAIEREKHAVPRPAGLVPNIKRGA